MLTGLQGGSVGVVEVRGGGVPRSQTVPVTFPASPKPPCDPLTLWGHSLLFGFL